MNIEKYDFSNDDSYNQKRPRKLLLNKIELKKLRKSVEKKGSSIIPYKLFINEKGLAKVKFGVGIGKKKFDKRETIKQREWDRKRQRILKK